MQDLTKDFQEMEASWGFVPSRSSRGTILAHKDGLNTLILSHIEPIKNDEGQRCSYRLEHRWMSETDDEAGSDARYTVLGNDFTFYRRMDIIDAVKSNNLFDHFSCIG